MTEQDKPIVEPEQAKRDVQDDKVCQKCGHVGRKARLVAAGVEVRGWQCLGKECGGPEQPRSCPNGGRCIELAEDVAQLRAERDRLLSANDTLVTRIEDLTEGYALEDTCPRVQCLTTSKRLKAEAYRLRMERDEARNQIKFATVNADEDYAELKAERDQYRKDASRLEAERDAWMDRCRSAMEERDLFGGMHQEVAAERDAMRGVVKAETCPERRETDSTILPATQDTNADNDRETGRNDA